MNSNIGGLSTNAPNFGQALRMLYRDRRNAARALADHARRLTAVEGLPVDPEQIAHRLGIRIEYREIEAEAQYSGGPDQPLIVVRRPSSVPPSSLRVRQRFVLAHEIGHHLVREELRSIWPTAEFIHDDPEEERLCDRFAAELLMPSTLIAAEIRACQLLPHLLIDVASRYAVSLEALLLRAVEVVGEHVQPMILNRDKDRWRVFWAASSENRDALFCDTGHTPIERTYSSFRPFAGTTDLLINGRRRRLNTIALRLGESTKVVCVFSRAVELAEQWSAFRHVTPPRKPQQQRLPFTARLRPKKTNDADDRPSSVDLIHTATVSRVRPRRS
jgi:hypothetical protein